jgi:membrane protease YdiL (CAAX protease family)
MRDTTSTKKPLVRPGWLRVLIFCVCYTSLTLVGIDLLPRITTMLTGELPAAGNPWSGNFLWISVLVVLFVSLVIVLVFRLLVDRKSFRSMGFEPTSGANALTGLCLSVTLLGTGTLVLYVSHHLKWTDITFNGNDLFIEFGLMGMIAFYEETVFRGYILNNLMESFGKWVALLISSLLFAFFHVNNPGMNVIAIGNIFLGGLLLGVNYIYTRNLWFSILFHLGWNFLQGPILGYKVSGINFSSLLQTELNGDALLTGGEFGFEGSAVNTALSLIMVLSLYLVYEKIFRQPEAESVSGNRP